MTDFAWFQPLLTKRKQYTWNATGDLHEHFKQDPASPLQTKSFKYSMYFQLNETKRPTALNPTLNTVILTEKTINNFLLTVNKNKKTKKYLVTTPNQVDSFHIRTMETMGANVELLISDLTAYNIGIPGFPLLVLRVIVNKGTPKQYDAKASFKNTSNAENRMLRMKLENVYTIHIELNLDEMLDII